MVKNSQELTETILREAVAKGLIALAAESPSGRPRPPFVATIEAHSVDAGGNWVLVGMHHGRHVRITADPSKGKVAIADVHERVEACQQELLGKGRPNWSPRGEDILKWTATA